MRLMLLILSLTSLIPVLAQQPKSTLKSMLNDFYDYIEYRNYIGPKLLSFEDTQAEKSITSIAKDKNISDIYTAEMYLDENKPSILFRNYVQCSVSSDPSIIESNISINGSLVKMQRICDWIDATKSQTQQLYIIKTDVGKSYVENEFLENVMVFVDFGFVNVPFLSAGFSEALIKMSEPAL